MNCKKCDRLQAEVDELWPFRKRAEKAEEERDEARANAYNWEATAEEWEKRALAAESHPRTPDAITDEMVRRAKEELEARAGGDYYPETLEAVLAAALTDLTREEA